MALFAVLFLSASFSVNGEAQVQNFPEMDLPTLATRVESAFEANPGEAIPMHVGDTHPLDYGDE